MVGQYPLTSFRQEFEGNPEAIVGGLGSGDGLEEQINRCPSLQRGQLRGDVGEDARLCRNAQSADESVQHPKDGTDGFRRIRRWIHADDGVAASKKQSLNRTHQDSQ